MPLDARPLCFPLEERQLASIAETDGRLSLGLLPAMVVGSLWTMAAVTVLGCNGLWGFDRLSYQSSATAGSGGAAGAGGGG